MTDETESPANKDATVTSPHSYTASLEELLSRVLDGEYLIKHGEYTVERAWHMAVLQAKRIKAMQDSSSATKRSSDGPQGN